MRSRYRKTIIGFFWVIAGPILTFLVQSIIFKEIFHLNISNYPLFLLSGLLPWFFINQTLNSVTSCLVLSRDVLLAFKINPLIIVSAQVIDQFVSFLAAFFFIFIVTFTLSHDFFSILQIVILILNFLCLLYFVLALTNLLSFWHVFYRDVVFVTQFLMGLIFYLTPIFYTRDFFPIKYSWILNLNFFIPYIRIFQDSIYQWNIVSWVTNFIYSMMINIFITLLIYLSYKNKIKVFYINV